MEGHQIGSYRIERKLGEGGMGVVWIGVDVRLGRRAAIKQLLPAMSMQRDIVERFFNEAKAAASINHPGIVEIYDVGWHTDGSAFFAMKLLEGDSLARRLRATGPMPVPVVATIARQTASALAAAHQRGIVHRDLKPDNIVLVADEEVSIGERATVLDFGIAKLFGDGPQSQKTRTGSVMGTPSYMSPEQCRGAGEVDHRTDVYALGCILFEMLTGRPPHVGEGAGEVLGMHQFVEPPTVSSLRGDVPPAFEAVVMRAIAKKPEARHQSMAELTAALQPFATMTGTSQPPPRALSTGPSIGEASTISSSHGQMSQPPLVGVPVKTRSRVWLGVGAGVVVATGIAIAVVASGGGGDKPAPAGGEGGDVASAPAAAIDAAPQAVAPAPSETEAVDARPSESDAILQAAIDALQARRWMAAVGFADEVLKRDPLNSAATELRTRAKAEFSFEMAHHEFVEAVQNRNYKRAVDTYALISADSVYKAEARPHLAQLEADFLGEQMKKAQKLVESHKCRDLEKLVADADKIFSEAAKTLARVPCEAAKDDPDRITGPGPEPTAGSVTPPRPPGGDGDAQSLLADAEAAAKSAQWLRALTLAEKAMATAMAKGDDATRSRAAIVAALGACNIKDAGSARRHYTRAAPTARTMIRQRCLAQGIEIP